MKNSSLRQAWYIGLLDSLPLLRDPMLLVVLSLISFLPVFFLYLFSGGTAALPALVGAVVLTLAFIGLFSAQSVYFYKHWFRFQDMFVASPVTPIAYNLGLSLSTLLSSAPSVVLALGALILAKPEAGVLGVLATLAVAGLLWISMVFCGFAIGASTKNTRRANSIPQVLGFLIGFLPPVYYELSLLPASIQPFALLVPSTHAAQLAKYYFGLLSLSSFEIVLGWTYLIAFTVVMGIIVSWKAKWVDP